MDVPTAIRSQTWVGRRTSPCYRPEIVNRVAAESQASGDLLMFVIRVTYPGGHSVWLTRRFPSAAWGPEKDALSFPTESRCRAHGCAPPTLWASYRRAYPIDTPEVGAHVIPWGHHDVRAIRPLAGDLQLLARIVTEPARSRQIVSYT